MAPQAVRDRRSHSYKGDFGFGRARAAASAVVSNLTFGCTENTEYIFLFFWSSCTFSLFEMCSAWENHPGPSETQKHNCRAKRGNTLHTVPRRMTELETDSVFVFVLIRCVHVLTCDIISFTFYCHVYQSPIYPTKYNQLFYVAVKPA